VKSRIKNEIEELMNKTIGVNTLGSMSIKGKIRGVLFKTLCILVIIDEYL
jgi:hypothetical protein